LSERALPSAASPMARADSVWNDEDDESSSDGNQPLDVDKPLCVAESFALTVTVLVLLLVWAGVGFWSVHAPGESELCTAETLGLQNRDELARVGTSARRTAEDKSKLLGRCHLLYTGVFDVLGILGKVYIGCAIACSASVCALAKGVSGVYRGEAGSATRWFCCAAMADVVGALVVWVPSLLFPEIAVYASGGMEVVHAYYWSIVAGHLGAEAANWTSGARHRGVSDASTVVDTLYNGYCAASKVELSLAVGSFCLLGLFWVLLLDAVRNLVTISVWKPDYEHIEGVQLSRACRNCSAACRRPQYGPEDDDS